MKSERCTFDREPIELQSPSVHYGDWEKIHASACIWPLDLRPIAIHCIEWAPRRRTINMAMSNEAEAMGSKICTQQGQVIRIWGSHTLFRAVFRDITPCSPLKIKRRCGGTQLQLYGRRASQAKNQHEAGGKQSIIGCACWFLAWLALRPWRWRRRVAPERWLIFNGLHGVRYIPEDRTVSVQLS
jgi:hypothetical protein